MNTNDPDHTICSKCGKLIHNVEYIRYYGICKSCWDKEQMLKTVKK